MQAVSSFVRTSCAICEETPRECFKMKTHAQAVVIGGGVIGCSILYHLTKLGWRDVILLARDELTSGST
jgi:glycerol-3-phosphate dehydrogenase